jgi:HEAT repeat protein
MSQERGADPDALVAELGSIAEGHVARPEALRRVRLLIADADPGVRAHAARAAAGYLDDAALAERTLSLAAADPDLAVRAAALGALGAVVRAGDLAGAWARDYSPDLEAGEPAAELARAALERLRGALASGEPSLRRAALPGLAACRGRDPAVDQAVEALWVDPDLSARVVALECMGRSGDGVRWGAQVRRALEAREPEVRLAAAEAAGAAGVREAVPRLIELLESMAEPEPLRVAAAVALGAFGGVAAAALLGVAEADPQEDVRAAAREALASL